MVSVSLSKFPIISEAICKHSVIKKLFGPVKILCAYFNLYLIGEDNTSLIYTGGRWTITLVSYIQEEGGP